MRVAPYHIPNNIMNFIGDMVLFTRKVGKVLLISFLDYFAVLTASLALRLIGVPAYSIASTVRAEASSRTGHQ